MEDLFKSFTEELERRRLVKGIDLAHQQRLHEMADHNASMSVAHIKDPVAQKVAYEKSYASHKEDYKDWYPEDIKVQHKNEKNHRTVWNIKRSNKK